MRSRSKIGSKDDIGYVGLVFQREEDESLGCTWALANDHASHNMNELIQYRPGRKLGSLLLVEQETKAPDLSGPTTSAQSIR